MDAGVVEVKSRRGCLFESILAWWSARCRIRKALWGLHCAGHQVQSQMPLQPDAERAAEIFGSMIGRKKPGTEVQRRGLKRCWAKRNSKEEWIQMKKDSGLFHKQVLLASFPPPAPAFHGEEIMQSIVHLVERVVYFYATNCINSLPPRLAYAVSKDIVTVREWQKELLGTYTNEVDDEKHSI